jgi:uncharacterized protein (DUF983 family)
MDHPSRGLILLLGKLFDFQKLGMVHDAHFPLRWAHFVTWGANVLIFQLYVLQETRKRLTVQN